MKKNIAVVGGGDSSEYVISVQSAAQIASVMDRDKYNTYVVSIRKGDWHIEGGEYDKAIIDKSDFSFYANDRKIQFDCAYITIHGTPGEDGILPGYFELMGIPHSTCDLLVSALTFDKYYCKAFLFKHGVLMAEEILVKRNDKIDAQSIIAKLGLPVFVKPANGGSSFGVTKVKNEADLADAIKLAMKEDDGDVLVEEFIEGKEITCGMVRTTEKEVVFPLTEIVSANDFFDYQAKYEGASDEITPARISLEETERCQELTRKVNRALNTRGITRTDYILKNGKFYFIEINTTPGMSAASIVPQQVRSMNLELRDVLSWIIEDSIARKAMK